MFVTKNVIFASIFLFCYCHTLVARAQDEQELPDSPVFKLHDGDHKELHEMFCADQRIRHSITPQKHAGEVKRDVSAGQKTQSATIGINQKRRTENKI